MIYFRLFLFCGWENVVLVLVDPLFVISECLSRNLREANRLMIDDDYHLNWLPRIGSCHLSFNLF